MSGLNFPKPYADWVAKRRVPFGFVLVAAFAWFSRPTLATLVYGIPVSVAGLLLRGWAAGHLAKNRQLTTSGPYAILRNPLYIGTSLVALGLVLASQSVPLGAVFAAVFLLIYLPVIQLEQQHLNNLFPDYARYMAEVPALTPRWPPIPSNRSFDFALYLKNREYRAAIGLATGVAFLIFKTTL
jgi:protein-S-isoprenylcysteine O-methyltransferase Ste14